MFIKYIIGLLRNWKDGDNISGEQNERGIYLSIPCFRCEAHEYYVFDDGIQCAKCDEFIDDATIAEYANNHPERTDLL